MAGIAAIFDNMAQKSEVWKFFTKTDADSKTKCKLCATKLKYTGGNTSSMKNHLKLVHKKTTLENTQSEKRQQTLQEMHKSKSILGEKQYNDNTRALAMAVALDVRPLALVKGRGFRHFCHKLNPLYKVCFHYSSCILHSNMKIQLKILLKKCIIKTKIY